MKCINCKKELSDESAFCIHCGERLSNIDIDNAYEKYNYNVDNQKVYDEVGAKVTEYGTNLKENLPIYLKKLKSFISKNKIATVIGTVAILALIITLVTFSFLKGRPINDNQLQSYLIGQNLNINGTAYEIEDGQIKSLEVISRKSVKKETDKVEGVVTLELDNATIEANVDFELRYDKSTSKWIFSNIRKQEVKTLEPKVDINDNIKDLIKNAAISYNYNKIDLKEGLLKDIREIKINGTGVKRDGTAQLLLSNGVIEATVSVNFVADFDLKEGNWKLNSDYLKSEIIKKEKIVDNIGDEEKKNFVLNAFEKEIRLHYKYKDGEYDNSKDINIVKDNISDLKINNFMEYEDKIRVEIEGQATSGDISKLKFSGVINLGLSLNSSNQNNTEITIDTVELGAINLDKIKKDLLKYKVEDKLITVAVADSFKLGSENKDSKIFDKVYEGTLTVSGVEEMVKTKISVNYNDKTKKYEWNLQNIDVIKKTK